jgi:3-hydroxybutyryl-CoA dehydrogenase
MEKIGILGAGTMGSGIAQVAATAGHSVVLVDINNEQLAKAKVALKSILDRLTEKGKISVDTANEIFQRIHFSNLIGDFANCALVIEAIVERIDIKKQAFTEIEKQVSETCIIASNTSSLSIASIGATLKNPSRVIGTHFFNPAPLMPLVEIIPAVQTQADTIEKTKNWMKSWGKTAVLVKDTPGFIVNRIARPFYGEALRIYEEGIADFATIDWAMTDIAGFKMGPFTLMDYIGNDVNYAVTESVFAAFYFDPRFKPSFTQKRHAEAGFLGRKSGRGYYSYAENTVQPLPNKDIDLGKKIADRIIAMLINEAFDALFLNIASKEDLDLAMIKGVNYPKGLLSWADEIGLGVVLDRLTALFEEYGEDRYRPCPLLKRLVRQNETVYS